MNVSQQNLAWDFRFPAIEGGTVDLSVFKGRVLLADNTASFCGCTCQYEGLEKLHQARASGVPSQDFNQESCDTQTVKTFCETKYRIDFPLAGVSQVRGPYVTPFYAWVREAASWEPVWNFNKVLIAHDGTIAGAIATALAKSTG